MNISDLIGVLIIAVTIAVSFWLNWRNERKRKAGKKDETLDLQAQKAIVTNAIAGVNSNGEWHNNDNGEFVVFSYQGGNFDIFVNKGSQFAKLRFPYIYEANPEAIDIVRRGVNFVNQQSDSTVMTYSIDDDTSKLIIHACANIYINRMFGPDTLAKHLYELFGWRDAIYKFVTQQSARYGHMAGDIEKIVIENGFNLRLIKELELTGQAPAAPRFSQAARPILADMMAAMTDIHEFLPVSMWVAAADGKSIQVETDDIRNFDLSSPLIADGRFKCDSAVLSLTYRDKALPNTERRMTMTLQRDTATESALFFRLTIAVIPLGTSPSVLAGNTATRPMASSSLLAYDLTSPTACLAKFNYLWKEAVEARKRGEAPADDAESKVLYDCLDKDIAFCRSTAKRLYHEKRYAEALAPLLNIITRMKADEANGKSLDAAIFADTCLMTGLCYSRLGRYDNAIFHMEFISTIDNFIYVKAFTNALVGGNDPRAMSYVDHNINRLEAAAKQLDDDDDDDDGNDTTHEGINNTLAFLKRRKAHLLADMGNTPDAEAILNEMIEGGVEPELARNEMAYVRKKKNAAKPSDDK